jgi:predicted nucleic acid-binding protein
MTDRFVLDACALIAFFYKEEGGIKVKQTLERAQQNNAEVYMNKLNVLEVYYNMYRVEGENKAEEFYLQLLKLPVIIIDNISDEVFRVAARLKSKYRMSLADSIAVGEVVTKDAVLLTSDHHELEAIESSENITVEWIR